MLTNDQPFGLLLVAHHEIPMFSAMFETRMNAEKSSVYAGFNVFIWIQENSNRRIKVTFK